MEVNPEGISDGDIISTRYGIARCKWVDEENGSLSYEALNDTDSILPELNMPIRQTSLVAKFQDKGQMELPFVQEMIEKVIKERNEELDKMRMSVTTKVATKASGKTPRKAKVQSEDELMMLEMIKGAGGIDALLKELKDKKK